MNQQLVSNSLPIFIITLYTAYCQCFSEYFENSKGLPLSDSPCFLCRCNQLCLIFIK